MLFIPSGVSVLFTLRQDSKIRYGRINLSIPMCISLYTVIYKLYITIYTDIYILDKILLVSNSKLAFVAMIYKIFLFQFSVSSVSLQKIDAISVILQLNIVLYSSYAM